MEGERSAAGISNLGMILSMAGFLVVLLIVAIVVSVTLPSNNTTANDNPTVSSSTSSTTSTTASASGTGAAAEVAACRSDVMDVQTALAAYQASNGSYPNPPAAWSAASYPTNFGPLTNAPAPGPFLKMPPGDNHYVILWDSAGHVWVEAPGTFSPTYDAANDAANTSTCTRVAR